MRFFVPAWSWARRPLAVSKSPGREPELGFQVHWRRRASTEQRAARVPGRRLPPCSMALQRASGHGERPWNSCLLLLPRKLELRLAKTFLSSLAWEREGTQWNLLPEDAHSDLGRESNSRTEEPWVPFAPSRGSLGGRGRTCNIVCASLSLPEE